MFYSNTGKETRERDTHHNHPLGKDETKAQTDIVHGFEWEQNWVHSHTCQWEMNEDNTDEC